MIISTNEIKQERGHCGIIRKLTSDMPCRFVHLIVDKAEKHFHKKTTEYYYVLNGCGEILLGQDIHPIQKGDLIKIEPGTVHQALENKNEELEILVIETPPAIGDCHKVT